MTGFFENLPVEGLELGAMDELGASLFKLWKSNRSQPGMPKELGRLSPYLLLTAGEAPAGDSPEILHVGHETLFGNLCPEATDSENVAPKSLLDEQFRKTAHVGYHCAIEEGLSYQLLSERCYPQGVATDITYERAIFRWKLKSGLVQLTTYVRALEIRQQISQANPSHEFFCSSPSRDHYRWSQVQFPNVFQPGELR